MINHKVRISPTWKIFDKLKNIHEIEWITVNNDYDDCLIEKDYFAVGNSNVKFGLNLTDPTYTKDKEVKNNPDMHF